MVSWDWQLLVPPSPRTFALPQLGVLYHFGGHTHPSDSVWLTNMTLTIIAVAFLLWVVLGGIIAILVCPLLRTTSETRAALPTRSEAEIPASPSESTIEPEFAPVQMLNHSSGESRIPGQYRNSPGSFRIPG